MPLASRKLRVPLGVQVGAVAVLFVAALVALWATGASVVARERRRSEAKNLLNIAGTNLADRGIQIIARGGEFPDFPEEASRSRLDRELSTQASAALADHEAIEGGYFVQRFKNFLGTAAFTGRVTKTVIETAGSQSLAPTPAWNGTSLPSLEADLIDIQVDAAIRKRQVLFSVEELEGQSPVTVAIRTAPLMVDGRCIGATWVITRLVDPLFADRSLQGYRLAAGLALGGIALAFGLTAGLARTVRRQATERDRLQIELRRSERLAALGKLWRVSRTRSATHWPESARRPSSGSAASSVSMPNRSVASFMRWIAWRRLSRACSSSLAPTPRPGPRRPERRGGRGRPAGIGNGRGSRRFKVEVDLDPDLPLVAMAPRLCSRSSAT